MRKYPTVTTSLARVVLLLTVTWIWSCQPEAGRDATQIVAILNLSGPAARFDAIKQDTLRVAEDRIRELYPSWNFEVQILDAGGGPESTIAAVRRAESWGAAYYLSGTSPTALAIDAELPEDDPQIVEMANAANPDFGPPQAGEYRLWPDWKHEAEMIFDLVKNEGLGSILLIHSADPYSEALTESLLRLVEDTDVSVREIQFDPAGTPDLRPALLRAREEERDAIVIFGLPPGIRELISQLAETQWEGALIGGVNINLAVDAYFTSGLRGDLWLIRTEAMREQLEEGTEAARFREAYAAVHGDEAPFHALYLTDGLYWIAKAESRGSGGTRVERLEAVDAFAGASGQIAVTEEGVLRYEMEMVKVR